MFNAAQGPSAHFIVFLFLSDQNNTKNKTKKQTKFLKNEEKNLVLRDIIIVNLNFSEGQPKSISLELKRQPMFTLLKRAFI